MKLKLYHGTNSKSVEDIKTNGLIDKTGNYSNPTWYMLSTDFESALFHSNISNDTYAYVVEFEIPLDNDAFWYGYPYLWKAYERSNNSSWFALKQRIPKEFIKTIHEVDYQTWFEQKNSGY